MSDEEQDLPLPIRTAHRVNRRAALGTLAACLAGGPGTTAAPPDPFRLATFSADVTPPLGHPLMGGGIAPAREVLDPLSARGFVLLGAGRPIVLAAIDWCEIRNDAFDRWREALAEAADTEPRRVLVTSLHQHDAPIADLAAQASAIARWIRPASTGRFSGEPSLYFPAVTLPLHPLTYTWNTPGISSCRRRRAWPMKSAETPPRP